MEYTSNRRQREEDESKDREPLAFAASVLFFLFCLALVAAFTQWPW